MKNAGSVLRGDLRLFRDIVTVRFHARAPQLRQGWTPFSYEVLLKILRSVKFTGF
jgi:hypothetical protein